MFVFKAFVLAVLACAYAQGQQGPTTTPVPILKQINRQNDDGSYSYGYEAADGSFKIETKYPNGDVAGKYGYVDAEGKTREISYGASSKRGFEPQGTGIVVPPPSENESTPNALADGQEDDGQYREDPRIYEDSKYNGRQSSRPAATFRQFHQPAAPAPVEPQYQAQNQQYQVQSQPQPSQFRSTPSYSQQSTNLFNQNQDGFFSQAPQQFSQSNSRPQSQVYHQQPQFTFESSFSSPTASYNQPQYQQPQYQQPQYQQPQYQQPQYQQYQPQNYQYQNQNFNPFLGHPAQNFDPATGSYSINFTG